MAKYFFIAIFLTGAAAFAISTQFSIFVIQPIGAMPEGQTLIISRLNQTQLADSADAMCARDVGGVSLLCRGMTIAAVLDNAKIIARFPYSERLYNISTDGRSYGR